MSTQANMGPNAAFYLETDGQTLSLEFFDGHAAAATEDNCRTIAWQAPPEDDRPETIRQHQDDFIWLARGLAAFHGRPLVDNSGDLPQVFRDPVQDDEVEVHRSAQSGQFVTEQYADEHPDVTVEEHVDRSDS